jgi:hypothetical protein
VALCESCRRAELTSAQRFVEDILAVVGIEHRASVWNRLMSPALALTGRTMYERHRADYERTGDPIELERMLRHVTTNDHITYQSKDSR